MKVAFYAPMKPPDHHRPSGDRRMARLLIEALGEAGFSPEIVSRLRIYDGKGDSAVQTALFAEAEGEVARVVAALCDDPPALWFTYHCYYKAPDLLGPVVAQTLGIPYVVAEASRARKRLSGPWADFATASERAVDAARTVFAMTEFDRFALDRDAAAGQRVVLLNPFVRVPDVDAAHGGGLRLLTVAMMRAGAKLTSYERLAAALGRLEGDWSLTVVGDGPSRGEVWALFAAHGSRVRFCGEVTDEAALRAYYEGADVFVWPGVDEAYGMVYLEAQAHGVPVIAEKHPGPSAVIGDGSRQVDAGDPAAFAEAILAAAADPDAPMRARRYVENHHSIEAAAALLRAELERLL